MGETSTVTQASGTAADGLPPALPLRQQAEVRNAWLAERLATLMPELMRREGVDLWIVSAREYNEDPLMLSLLPAPMLSARRRTTLIFHAPEGGPFEAMAIANAGVGLDGHYRPMWAKTQDAQAAEGFWDCLRRVVEERAPKRIAINVSEEIAFADGLSKNEHDELRAALGEALWSRSCSAEALAVAWLERRTAAEVKASDDNNARAHAVIAEAFSDRVLKAGHTTAKDLVWWLRQRAWDLGYPCWFQPSISLQRRGAELGSLGATPDTTILAGDLVHCDFGFHHLGLATDTQQNAYVLLPGETEPPAGLQRAFELACRQQDLLEAQMVVGRSGNEVLAGTLAAMAAEGLRGRIYSHPIGYHGHGAGPTIGLFDQQDGVPGRGDILLRDHTLYAFEMYLEAEVPEWDGQTIKMATEQGVALVDGRIRYLGGRPTQLHLVGAGGPSLGT